MEYTIKYVSLSMYKVLDAENNNKFMGTLSDCHSYINLINSKNIHFEEKKRNR